MIKTKFIFIMLMGVLLISGCASTGGHVASGIYTSPHGNFTVPLPKMGLGARVQEKKFETSGFVSFHDDFGTLKRIDYSALPANANVVYRDLIHNVVLPDMQSRFPGSKLLHEEAINNPEKQGYFFVLKIPQGSPLVDMKTGKGMDSTRGYLYFTSQGYIYSLSMQKGGLSDLLAGKKKVKSVTPKSFDDILNSLQKFKKTIHIRDL
ncbi:MAG: hypothetical protein JKX85_03430 [Phycisphaeraceae bacterium]|nr:hypothetical protein [Phycisphaeraceae bacterium]